MKYQQVVFHHRTAHMTEHADKTTWV